MTDHPYTREAVERWQQGKTNIFDSLAELEDQRDEARELYNSYCEAVENYNANWCPKAERDQWRECAERLIDYAHESLAKLASWGSGYERYEAQMEQIRADIAEFDRLKEASK